MHNLAKLCLKKPVSTVIIIVALIIFGLSSITGMNMQLTPDMQLPMIIALTVYPQAGPEEVDRLVTQTLENVGATVQGLDSVTSRSMENASYLIYSFEYGADIDQGYSDLQKEINMVKSQLPDDCQDPILIVMDINAMESMDLSISATSESDVRTFVEKVLEPEISSISNVASTSISGGQKDYVSIEVNPALIAEYGLDLSTIASFITTADFSLPAGSVDMGTQTLNVNAKVEYDNIYDLQNVPLLTNRGSMIRLSDVATVSYSQETIDSISRYDGEDSVNLAITKKQGSNAVSLSRDVIKKIEEISKDYPDMQIKVIYDSSTSIISSLKSVAETLVLGVVLSMAVLFLFFGDVKASLIVGSSMPVSLLVTVLLMYACGYSLNVVTLGAMVIGIGMMVDNSIVVLEMCFQKKDQGLDFAEAALDAVKVVAMSVTASTITTVVVYLPLALLKGLSGQIFGQLGFTIIFSLTASLIAAVTLVPLCFAKYHPIEKKEFFMSRFVRNASEKYGEFMRKVLNKRKTAIAITVVIVIITIVCAQFINTELMPATDEGTVQVSADIRPGLSMDAKDELLKQLEEFAANEPDVSHYSVTAASGSNITLTAYLRTSNEGRKRSTTEVADDWNKELADMKNCEILCTSVSTMSMGDGMGGSSISIDIKSMDMDKLRTASNIICDAVRNEDGVISAVSQVNDSSTKAEIEIDPAKATAAGLMPIQIAQAIYTAKNGVDVMDMSMNEKDYDVKLEFPKDMYDDMYNLLNITIPTNFGTQIVVSDVADVKYTDTPQTIYRSDGYYQVSITVNVDSEKYYELQKTIDKIMKDIQLPGGVYMADDQYTEMMNEEFTSIFTAILIAMWLVFMVMTMQFESARYAGLIMFCIPFSLVGSALLLLITRTTLSMPSMMGFLMLQGIVVNNGILMVDTTNQYLENMEVKEALVAAGKSRLRPILMTTLTTILSMFPMCLGIGNNGQLMQGMAVVIVGGLVASTILTLVLLPTFYMIVRKKDKKMEENTIPA